MAPAPLATPADIAAAAQLACLLEASAPKPGNVSPGRNFSDLAYTDFLASAAAIGEPFLRAGERRVGETILRAIESTSRWVGTNSNLGIVLLFAPLARAANLAQGDLHSELVCLLNDTTVDDARDVYAAIRLAAPRGLGEADDQDVRNEPTVTLLEAMTLAADRDGVAREYQSRYQTTFRVGVPALGRARKDGLSWDDAVVELFLTLLAAHPDTHIARRGGVALAAEVSDQARGVIARGGVRSPEGRRAIEVMDRALRDPAHTANPGTTADLAAASVFVLLLEGGGVAV
jgi:triphosphoribosyl-dephospho-CoA synthase